jgi:hypothetical protein
MLGKTHTMGSSVALLCTEDEGIIPRVLRNVFTLAEQKTASATSTTKGDDHTSSSTTINLRLSFVEIYNEEIRYLRNIIYF